MRTNRCLCYFFATINDVSALDSILKCLTKQSCFSHFLFYCQMYFRNFCPPQNFSNQLLVERLSVFQNSRFKSLMYFSYTRNHMEEPLSKPKLANSRTKFVNIVCFMYKKMLNIICSIYLRHKYKVS